MPEMMLRRSEVGPDDLPRVCARCGEAATGESKKTFSWTPGWVLILVLLSLFVGFLVVMAVQKSMTVYLPLCDRHRAMVRRRWWTLVGLLPLGAALLVGGVVMVAKGPPAADGNPGGFFALAGFAVLFGTLGLAAVYQQSFIRATIVTDIDLTLTGLDKAFVGAVRTARRDERNERDDEASDAYEERLRKRRLRQHDRDDHE